MHKTISICATAALATLGVSAEAQEISGRVISSTPVVQQVQVPRQICDNQPVAVQQPKSGAGAVIGAIAGGAMGNAVGGGSGRAAATVLGLVGGAMVGDRVEGGPVSVQNMQRCTTQTFYENRTVGYNVAYEYGGRQYAVQMPNDPGPTVRLQVSPAPTGSGSYPLASSDGVSAPAGVVSVPGVVASSSAPTVVYPNYYPATPVYPAYPAYYPAYYPPVGISLGFGFGFGGGGGHRHHWR